MTNVIGSHLSWTFISLSHRDDPKKNRPVGRISSPRNPKQPDACLIAHLDHPRYRKPLGSPPFISHKFRPLGTGTPGIGDLRSPWLYNHLTSHGSPSSKGLEDDDFPNFPFGGIMLVINSHRIHETGIFTYYSSVKINIIHVGI